MLTTPMFQRNIIEILFLQNVAECHGKLENIMDTFSHFKTSIGGQC